VEEGVLWGRLGGSTPGEWTLLEKESFPDLPAIVNEKVEALLEVFKPDDKLTLDMELLMILLNNNVSYKVMYKVFLKEVTPEDRVYILKKSKIFFIKYGMGTTDPSHDY